MNREEWASRLKEIEERIAEIAPTDGVQNTSAILRGELAELEMEKAQLIAMIGQGKSSADR